MKTVAIHSTKLRKSRGDRIFDVLLYTFAALGTLIALYPMYFILIASISDPNQVAAGNIVWRPIGLTFKGYDHLFNYAQLWVGYRNTIAYVLVGTLLCLAVNIPVAYSLSRKDLVGRKFLSIYFLIPMFFSGGLIPTYMVVKDFGLLDTFAVMVLPFSVITYYIIVARTFFKSSLPAELWESAQIDGCGNLRYFFTFVLPLSKAIIAVIALWAAVGTWNAYFNALIYIQSESLRPLQLVLRNILISNQVVSNMTTGVAAMEAQKAANLIKYCAIVIASAPIMCMYPFVQKYFNQGVMIGALKG
ncbi:MAG: carbohydrate ABC transporter permease [Clostridia bacterium]